MKKRQPPPERELDDGLDPHMRRLLGEQQAYVDEAKRETELLARESDPSGLLGIEEEITDMHGTMKEIVNRMGRPPTPTSPEIHVHVTPDTRPRSRSSSHTALSAQKPSPPPSPVPPGPPSRRHGISLNPPVIGRVHATGYGLLALVVLAALALIALAAGWLKLPH